MSKLIFALSLLLALAGCVTTADMTCRLTGDTWQCDGGVGGVPPTDSPGL